MSPLHRLTACLLTLTLAGFVAVRAPGVVADEGDAAAAIVLADPEEAANDADFQVQGELQSDGAGAQVIALGEGRFRIVRFQGGLPGDGWDGSPRKEDEGDASFVAAQLAGWRRVTRESPTLGAAPPEGAVVLFDGTRECFAQHWQPGAHLTDDGLLQEGAASIDAFQDHALHLEFRLPYMPQARGQGRGNSGLYIHARYECQILDSFGLAGENNECGGIYSIARPDVNMCFPPLAWQTYDVDLTAARFNDAGAKTASARVTIRHNGVVIHDDLELPTHTPGGAIDVEDSRPGPIFLQDHKNPVRFRNIWVVPR